MSTSNVSWSKPFGDSAAGQGGGAIQNNISNATNATNANLGSMGSLSQQFAQAPNLGSLTNGVNTPWGAGSTDAATTTNNKLGFGNVIDNQLGLGGVTTLNPQQQKNAARGEGAVAGGLVGSQIPGVDPLAGAAAGYTAVNAALPNSNPTAIDNSPSSTTSPISEPTTPPPLTQLAPGQGTSTEDSLRNAYLNALNPNYGYAFNNNGPQAGNQFTANASVQKGK